MCIELAATASVHVVGLQADKLNEEEKKLMSDSHRYQRPIIYLGLRMKLWTLI